MSSSLIRCVGSNLDPWDALSCHFNAMTAGEGHAPVAEGTKPG